MHRFSGSFPRTQDSAMVGAAVMNVMTWLSCCRQALLVTLRQKGSSREQNKPARQVPLMSTLLSVTVVQITSLSEFHFCLCAKQRPRRCFRSGVAAKLEQDNGRAINFAGPADVRN